MPRYSYRRDHVLSPAEVAQMQVDSPLEAAALFGFLYEYGPRISEALKLRKDELTIGKDRMTADLITLKRKSRGPVVPRRKVSRPVTSPFLVPFFAYLEYVTDDGKVFPISRRTAHNWIKKVNSQASCHLFRHTRATLMAEETGDPFKLWRFFGWRSLDMAVNYVHMRQD